MFSKKTLSIKFGEIILLIAMGSVNRRIITGPKSNLLQMSLNYVYNFASSILYALIVGQYLNYLYSPAFIVVEVILNLVCMTFSLSCTFADPGIITIKTHFVSEDEESDISGNKISEGSDFYM